MSNTTKLVRKEFFFAQFRISLQRVATSKLTHHLKKLGDQNIDINAGKGRLIFLLLF